MTSKNHEVRFKANQEIIDLEKSIYERTAKDQLYFSAFRRAIYLMGLNSILLELSKNLPEEVLESLLKKNQVKGGNLK